jgi:hypothetical protein
MAGGKVGAPAGNRNAYKGGPKKKYRREGTGSISNPNYKYWGGKSHPDAPFTLVKPKNPNKVTIKEALQAEKEYTKYKKQNQLAAEYYEWGNKMWDRGDMAAPKGVKVLRKLDNHQRELGRQAFNRVWEEKKARNSITGKIKRFIKGT